jgi:hypothetical protein
MLNEYSQDQLDYNMILLKHIDRISILSTIIREESPSVDISDGAKRRAYLQAIYSLKALIPESLKDDQYFEESNKAIEDHSSKATNEKFDDKQREELDFYHRFRQLGIIINLLNRKGLILSRQLPARKEKKKRVDEDNSIKEVFEE